MKQLVLIRHAKSSWKDPALTDLKRPLKKRGEQDAPAMAVRLAALNLPVEKVFLSPARRVMQTVELMTGETGFARGLTEVCPELYTFSYEDIMLFLREQREWDCVGVVGHNPAITDLVNFLTLEELNNVPTCGIAVIDLDISGWDRLGAGNGQLRYYDFPKNDQPITA